MNENLHLRRVALVEDDPDIRAIGELALRDIGGLEVQAYASGLLALRGLRTCEVDIVLLDAKMPGMSGEETLQNLRSTPATCGIPAIFVTANSQQHDIDRYRELGALDVITKPFDPMTLARRVEEIWLKHRESLQ